MKNFNITAAFETPLKRVGFQKHSDSWYLNREETILVANLQKSNYGQRYFVNLAVWVKALGEASYPKEHVCHITIRLRAIAGDDSNAFFDLTEPSISNEDRQSSIESLMAEKAIPFLMSCASLAGIRENFRVGKLKEAMLHKNLRALVSKEPI